MLSYQHGYHAGNLADVHKHAALAWALSYLTRKDKPISYIETHAGRGLYDLAGIEARKTGEAAAGIQVVSDWFNGHPYGAAVDACKKAHGANAYPGSPWIAAHVLRPNDKLTLAELHPTENAALRAAIPRATIHKQDGFDLALSMSPPIPRRGLMLIDPSYEVKTDYDRVPKHLAKIAKAWPVGVILLWYPLLRKERHKPMVNAILAAHAGALHHKVAFPAAREGHGMIGSGLIVLNPPWGLDKELLALSARFDQL